MNIVLNDISKSYDGTAALRGCSVLFNARRFFGSSRYITRSYTKRFPSITPMERSCRYQVSTG